MSDYDVIVIGAGGAGLAATAEAARAGARVLLVEAGAKTGGSTSLAGGVFYAAGTEVQRAKGIDGDTPDAMFQYYMTLNQYKLDPALVRRLCDDAPGALTWLQSLGVTFKPEDLYVSGVDKIARGHRAAGMGESIARALEGAFSGMAVDVALKTRVRNLVVENGRVTGIDIDGDRVTAKAVVIATGGFGANADKLAAHYPDATRHGDLHWYIGARECLGDGLDMGQAVGAGVGGHNLGLLLVTPGFAQDLETYLPGWLMFVNRNGQRFIDETIEYSVLASALNDQPGQECFAIFDEESRKAARTTAYRPAPNWTADRLAELTAQGYITSAPTLAALAEKLGIRADALEATAARYNQNVATQHDASFFKPSTMLRPVATGPFYAARVKAAIICWTGCGLKIDTDAHVLDEAGRPIAGLYAAGETTSGMFGACYAAGGASIANAVVYGRIAGRNAAADAVAG